MALRLVKSQEVHALNLNRTMYDPARLSTISRKFSFVAPFGTAILGPLLLNNEYKQKSVRPDERRMLVFQELASQGVNLGVHVASFLFGSKLARYGLTRRFPGLGKPALEAAVTIAANMGSFMGMAFLRPIVSAKLLNQWMNRTQKPDRLPVKPVALAGPVASGERSASPVFRRFSAQA